MKLNTKRCIIFLIIIGIIFALRFSGIERYLNFENIQKHKNEFKAFVENKYVLSAAIYTITYLIVTASSIPGATILSLIGGYLFGVIACTLYINFSATIGATIAFLLSRYLIGNWVQRKFSAKLEYFNKEIKENGSNYLLILRFIPLFPFFLINIFAGLTRVNVGTFIWTTSVGILPGTLVYTFAGKQIGEIQSPKDILSTKILIAFLLLAVFAILPVLYKKYKSKKVS